MKNYSRRELYALGETLGESATRMEAGRRVYGGGGGSAMLSSVANTVQPVAQAVQQQQQQQQQPAQQPFLMGSLASRFPNVTQALANPSADPTGIGRQLNNAANAAVPAQQPAPMSQATNTPMGTAPGVLPQTQTETQAGVADYAQPFVNTMLGSTMQQLFNYDQYGNATGMRGFDPYSYNPADYFAAFTPMQEQAQYGIANLQNPWQSGYASNALSSGIQQALGMPQQSFTDPGVAAQYMDPFLQNAVNVQQREAKRQAKIASQAQQAAAVRAGAFGGGRDLIQRGQANRALQAQLQDIQAQGLQKAYQQAQQQYNTERGLGLQGLQAGMSGANQLGSLGTTGLQNQLSILNAQQQAGAAQQALQQQIINQGVQNYNTAQQYPYMQLGFMQNMLQGLPITTSSQQQYQAAPSTVSQLAGLGLGLGSLLRGMGGTGSTTGTGGGTSPGGIVGGLNSVGGGISGLINSVGNIAKNIPVVGDAISKVGGWLGFDEGGQVEQDPVRKLEEKIDKNDIQGLIALAMSQID